MLREQTVCDESSKKYAFEPVSKNAPPPVAPVVRLRPRKVALTSPFVVYVSTVDAPSALFVRVPMPKVSWPVALPWPLLEICGICTITPLLSVAKR